MRLALAFVSILLVPSLAHAQAEPAPPGYVPPGHEKLPPPPSPYKWHASVDADLVVPLGTRPGALPPVGWGAGVQLSRALVDVGRLRFGVGASFAYRRVQHDVKTTIPFGDTQQFLSHMTFAGLLMLDGIFGRLHPWFGAGGGVSVAQWADPATTPGMMSTRLQNVVPLVQIALGLDVEVWRRMEVGIAAEMDPTFSSTTVGNPARTAFSPGFFALRVGVGFRF
jgi:hypothetical protein